MIDIAFILFVHNFFYFYFKVSEWVWMLAKPVRGNVKSCNLIPLCWKVLIRKTEIFFFILYSEMFRLQCTFRWIFFRQQTLSCFFANATALKIFLFIGCLSPPFFWESKCKFWNAFLWYFRFIKFLRWFYPAWFCEERFTPFFVFFVFRKWRLFIFCFRRTSFKGLNHFLL